MTLEFARKEAQRRTAVLRTVHYVLKAKTEDGYLVTTLPIATYEVMGAYAYCDPALLSTEGA